MERQLLAMARPSPIPRGDLVHLSSLWTALSATAKTDLPRNWLLFSRNTSLCSLMIVEGEERVATQRPIPSSVRSTISGHSQGRREVLHLLWGSRLEELSPCRRWQAALT